jgi:hypothetical protein
MVYFVEGAGITLAGFEDVFSVKCFSIICFQHIHDDSDLFTYFSEARNVFVPYHAGFRFYFQLPSFVPLSYKV